MESRYRNLLAVAAVLAALRFVLIPWLDLQAEQHDRVQVLTQRLDRAEGVVENREAIKQAVQSIEKQVADLRQRFPTNAQGSAFRLDTQQQVGASVRGAGLTLRSFEWILDGEATDAKLGYARARLQVEGEVRILANWLAIFEAQSPHVAIRELNFLARNPVTGADGFRGSVSIVADVYRRPLLGGAP